MMSYQKAVQRLLTKQLHEMAKEKAELEAENARLRQQRDAATAQLDFLIEEVKTRSGD